MKDALNMIHCAIGDFHFSCEISELRLSTFRISFRLHRMVRFMTYFIRFS